MKDDMDIGRIRASVDRISSEVDGSREYRSDARRRLGLIYGELKEINSALSSDSIGGKLRNDARLITQAASAMVFMMFFICILLLALLWRIW